MRALAKDLLTILLALSLGLSLALAITEPRAKESAQARARSRTCSAEKVAEPKPRPKPKPKPKPRPKPKPKPKPRPKPKPKPKPKPRARAEYYTITFYCRCTKCCGKSDGITASGKKARAGRTVAAPKGIKFGTRLRIDGLGERIVEDRGGSIKGKRIDVFVGSHSEALRLGKKRVKVWILD